MAWTLEIIHFDVGQGDATLITAQMQDEENNDDVAPQSRAILVDGGLVGAGNALHTYLQARANRDASTVDIIVCTHYDQDHVNGLTTMLNKDSDIYDGVIIYDQGDPRAFGIENRYRPPASAKAYVFQPQVSDHYKYYSNAIDNRGTCHRITKDVLSLPYEHHDRVNNVKPADWLLGKEIMWRGTDGAVTTPAALLGQGANVNTNPPTVTVVGVNGYLLGDANRQDRTNTHDADRIRNQRSVALLVEFGNFKYYVGGDLETDQENYLQTHLNPNFSFATGVSVFKCSHHGSNHSTSSGFLQQIKAEAAIISNGFNRVFGAGGPHPDPQVLNRLQNDASLVRYFMTNDRTPAQWDQRVGNHYDDPNTPNTAGDIAVAYSDKAVVAGWRLNAPYPIDDPPPNPRHIDASRNEHKGNILLYVTQKWAESDRSNTVPMDADSDDSSDDDDMDGNDNGLPQQEESDEEVVKRFQLACKIADAVQAVTRTEHFFNFVTHIQ